MKKRFLALLFALSLSVCMCVSAFATDTGIDIIDDPLSYYFQNQLLGVQKGTGVTLVCPNGDYKTLYTGGTLVTCPYDGEALVLADAGGVTAKKAPSGIGRKDLPGYVDDNGTPTYNSFGALQIVVEPYALGVYEQNCKFVSSDNGSLGIYYKGASGSGLDYRNGYWTGAVYRFVAPVTGLYYIGNNCSLYNFGSLEIFLENEKNGSPIILSLLLQINILVLFLLKLVKSSISFIHY